MLFRSHVPYKGVALATTDILSGQIQSMWMTLAAGPQLVNAGRLRALGVGTLKRVQILPDLPTIAEQGYPGFEASSWFGLSVPAGTPAAIVNRLNREFVAIMHLPEVSERLSAQGFEVVGNSQRAFADYIRSEIPKWARVIKASGARPD